MALEKLLDKLFTKKVIGGSENPLLVRWHIWRGQRGIYLHKLCRSDAERHVHDHPWDFTSVILSRGYFEFHQTETDRHDTYDLVSGHFFAWLPRFSILRRRASWAHRIELLSDDNSPVWTLVFRGKVRREWGFYTEHGWVHHRRYRDLMDAEPGKSIRKAIRDLDEL
jgi:hypothetical protein